MREKERGPTRVKAMETEKTSAQVMTAKFPMPAFRRCVVNGIAWRRPELAFQV